MNFVKRTEGLSKQQDFRQNVMPKLNDNLIVEEVYQNDELKGWKIDRLVR